MLFSRTRTYSVQVFTTFSISEFCPPPWNRVWSFRCCSTQGGLLALQYRWPCNCHCSTSMHPVSFGGGSFWILAKDEVVGAPCTSQVLLIAITVVVKRKVLEEDALCCDYSSASHHSRLGDTWLALTFQIKKTGKCMRMRPVVDNNSVCLCSSLSIYCISGLLSAKRPQKGSFSLW